MVTEQQALLREGLQAISGKQLLPQFPSQNPQFPRDHVPHGLVFADTQQCMDNHFTCCMGIIPPLKGLEDWTLHDTVSG